MASTNPCVKRKRNASSQQQHRNKFKDEGLKQMLIWMDPEDANEFQSLCAQEKDAAGSDSASAHVHARTMHQLLDAFRKMRKHEPQATEILPNFCPQDSIENPCKDASIEAHRSALRHHCIYRWECRSITNTVHLYRFHHPWLNQTGSRLVLSPCPNENCEDQSPHHRFTMSHMCTELPCTIGANNPLHFIRCRHDPSEVLLEPPLDTVESP
eukprot:GILJ01007333.1.p1 GENE.GILJ01007333.1~~GILJ01007333.1.p1  ORF type:complete len:224 (+),score=3.36 GILJ01007333.1:39-674(+)